MTTETKKQLWRKIYVHLAPGEHSQNDIQIIERDFADSVKEKMESFVASAENWVDAILTTMDIVVLRRFEIAMRSNTESTVHEENNVV